MFVSLCRPTGDGGDTGANVQHSMPQHSGDPGKTVTENYPLCDSAQDSTHTGPSPVFSQ